MKLANRFERIALHDDWEQLDPDADDFLPADKIQTEYFDDQSESIVSQNNSPDINFDYSANPYRGCAHGCSYCYARPSHEYLGLNAGLDFESKILVKKDAAKLLRKWLRRKSWAAMVQPIMLSGVTDPYQPCERQFKLTQQCLEVCLEMRQPVRVITKNSLIRRDVDLLAELAAMNLTYVTISLTSLDQSLVRVMEPRTSSPAARLDAIGKLSQAGVPVCVLTAPIIPGLNDEEIPKLLEAVADAGARSTGYTILRLPLSVEPVFIDWLENHFPDRKDKILDRVRTMRDGKLYNSNFATRMKGSGIWADQIRQLHQTFATKHGLVPMDPRLNCDLFRATQADGKSQQSLF